MQTFHFNEHFCWGRDRVRFTSNLSLQRACHYPFSMSVNKLFLTGPPITEVTTDLVPENSNFFKFFEDFGGLKGISQCQSTFQIPEVSLLHSCRRVTNRHCPRVVPNSCEFSSRRAIFRPLRTNKSHIRFLMKSESPYPSASHAQKLLPRFPLDSSGVIRRHRTEACDLPSVYG